MPEPQNTPEQEPYEVAYFNVKAKNMDDAFMAKIQKLSEDGVRSYVNVADNNDLLLAASTVDDWLTKFIQIIGPANVSLMTGKPQNPPICPPGGCH